MSSPEASFSLEKNSVQSISVYFIDDTQQLDKIAQSWKNKKCLAVDTEFERRTTFYAKLALVQFFDGDNIYLIDPLQVECPNSLKEIFSNPSITKILHSCKEDLEVLYTAWDCKINNLFDTQIAYSFLHQEPSIGYAKLVEVLTSHFVSKNQTTSDWIKRPLSTQQLNYASKDVLYLIQIYNQLKQNIISKDYYQYFEKECLEFCELSIVKVQSHVCYRDAKDVWQLNSIDLSLFKELFNWRENRAKTDNRTKNHIIKDHEMVVLAKEKLISANQLKQQLELHPRSIRLYSQDWFNIVQQWQKTVHDEITVIANPRDVVGLKPLSNQLESIVKSVAKSQNIATTLLLSKRVIRKVAFSFLTGELTPSVWQGWRKNLLNDSFQKCFNEFKANTNTDDNASTTNLN